MDLSSIYKIVSPSVVNILQIDPTTTKVSSTASGVIIGDGSKVLTCAHCLNTKNLNGIYDNIEESFIPGKISYLNQTIDIGILDMPNTIGVPAILKDSNQLEIGNEIFTIGFPYSFPCEKTLTCGNIAAFEKGLIKLDSSVNNGNSGGPLFNVKGEVVGIVNAKLGSLSKFLENIESARTQTLMSIGGIDPVQTIQQMIREMNKNLNLGIGYAIPTNVIANNSPLIKSLIK